MPRLRDKLPSLPSGLAAVVAGLVAGLTPPPAQTVSVWAEENRFVAAESGSPFPGKWSNDVAPYMVEVMDCLSLDDPCRDVVLKKSHQVAGSECGINLIGQVIDRNPAPILVVLPTLEEAQKYNRVKLAPTFAATPNLRHKVREERNTRDKGSTASFKRFRGGYLQLTGANSSRGLQMLSARVLLAEEISEWPAEVGERGDPLSQAEKRTTAWSKNRKHFYVSTPGIKGLCRITKKYEASDQRQHYVPCPHCGTYQILKRENLKRRQDHAPYGAYFQCASANGCVVEHYQKRPMVAAGIWVSTYPDEGAEPPGLLEPDQIAFYRARSPKGRNPGFSIWQAYSNLVSWDDTTAAILDAEGDAEKEIALVQQVFGEAYEVAGEAPDHEKLYLMREDYPRGRVTPGGLVLTGFCDVQANRLEWGVYAWGIGLTGWLVDHGVIPGDPSHAEVWRSLDAVIDRTYENDQGHVFEIEAFGVDTGYLSHEAYNFCRGRPERVLACDGMPGYQRPMIGTPVKVDVNRQGKVIKRGCLKWPTGTWSLKRWVYTSLRKTLEGPDGDGYWRQGCLHYYQDCDEDFFKQLTAESLIKHEHKDGRVSMEWRKPRDQANEQLDIAVGARAMAYHLGLDRTTAEGWATIAAERGAPPEQTQRDLAELWSPSRRDASKLAAAEAEPAKTEPEQPNVVYSPWLT